MHSIVIGQVCASDQLCESCKTYFSVISLSLFLRLMYAFVCLRVAREDVKRSVDAWPMDMPDTHTLIQIDARIKMQSQLTPWLMQAFNAKQQ